MIRFILRLSQATALLATQLLVAQNFTGTAVYEVKTKLPAMQLDTQKEIPSELQKELEAQLKSQFEKTYTLNFNKAESSWEEQQKLKAPQPSSGISIMMMGSDNSKRYNNLKTMTTLSEEVIFDKEFLISDALPKWEWQMTNETKKIGDYTCHKAIAVQKVTDEERAEYEKRKKEADKNPNRMMMIDEPEDYQITAWYTPDIPVGHGPEEFWGLPGLILEVSDGHRIILCSKITINPKNKTAIYIPKNGEKVTRRQFGEISEKKMKEFSDMRQGRENGDVQMIRIGG